MRPLRRKNFAEVTLHRRLVRAGEGWRIGSASAETKTGEPIDVPFPTELVPYLERYLDHYRTLLIGERYRGDRLWVGYFFKPQSPHTIGTTITECTKRAFGRPVNVHLFRDCAATSIAVHDPDHVRIAAAVVGHRSFATTQRHYNLATALRPRETTKQNSSGSGRPSQITPSSRGAAHETCSHLRALFNR